MPYGDRRIWVRLRAAIAGFYLRHGCWPTKIRVFPGCIEDLRNDLFTEASFGKLQEKVTLTPDPEGSFIASNDAGATFDYGPVGFVKGWYDVDVVGWLGVTPDRTGAG
jgi:hypothetical protein